MTQEERIQKAAYEYYIEQINKEFTPWVTDSTGLGMPIHMALFGAKYALEHQWISVDDELPKESGWYLILNINSNEPDFADTCQFDVDKGYWYTDIGGQRLLHEITHWMEIPKMNKD